MRRRLFTLAGTASLVLCLAAAAMWVRSTRRTDMFTAPGRHKLVVRAGLFLVQRLRAQRRPCTGRCARCGYDLRATPERCPECGAVPNPPHNLPLERTGPAV
ncbi:MAG TPA: hypothetical protein VGR35_21660 [Tepidisphaeraceae bacterium]|nr:hypothetical protein [Tepidisphaeraceae bacterium]